jgi:hypothetical protein
VSGFVVNQRRLLDLDTFVNGAGPFRPPAAAAAASTR